MNEATIMIVEDDEEMCDLLKIRIESLNYKTLVVQKGDEAITLAKQKLPDLIVLDVFLPDMDGLTVLKRMKVPIDIDTGKPSKTKDIPVIVITGKAPMIENMTRVEGAADFFVKPLNMDKLSKRISQLLEQRQHDRNPGA